MKNHIKKFVSAISVMAMCLTVSPVGASATIEYLRGDVTGDGKVNLIDIAMADKYLRGMVSADGAICERLDVNRDYIIDRNDVNEIYKINLGMSSTAPISSANTVMTAVQSNTRYKVYDAKTGTEIDSYTLNQVSSLTQNQTSLLSAMSDVTQSNTCKDGIVVFNNYGVGIVVNNHTILTTASNIVTFTSNGFDIDDDLIGTIYGKADDGSIQNIASLHSLSYHIPVNYLNRIKTFDYALITVQEDLGEYMNVKLAVCRDGFKNNAGKFNIIGWATHNPTPPSNLYDEGTMCTTENRSFNTIGANTFYYSALTQYKYKSGSPLYIENSDGSISVIGLHRGNSEVAGSEVARRIDTNILHFVYNNPNI